MFGQYKQQLDGMMRHELTRAEFLRFIGIGLLGLFGVIGFLKNLHEIVPAHTAVKNHPAPAGYGHRAYGR